MRAGVDEAGRGPVLGSMFAAGVRADSGVLPDGVRDSKVVPPAQRERLDEEIREVADAVAVTEVRVERIDDPSTDMNSLTVEAHTDVITRINRGGLVIRVDACDTDATRFERRLTANLDRGTALIATHGADADYPIVAAASIVAKVARDAHVESLAGEYGEVGSGYPSDTTTRTFLRDHVEREGTLPACARSSWQTCDDILAGADQATLGGL